VEHSKGQLLPSGRKRNGTRNDRNRGDGEGIGLNVHNAVADVYGKEKGMRGRSLSHWSTIVKKQRGIFTVTSVAVQARRVALLVIWGRLSRGYFVALKNSKCTFRLHRINAYCQVCDTWMLNSRMLRKIQCTQRRSV
jgi:hypothetical protein